MEKYILERNLKGIYQDITDDNKKINKEVKNNIITYFNNATIVKAAENGFTITPKVITAKSIITDKDIPAYLKYFNLKKYLLNTSLGCYINSNDVIELYLKNLLLMIDLKKDITIEEIKFLKFIYHELAHQIQFKNEKNEIIEGNLKTILQDANRPITQNRYALYHDYFELEIDANIQAFKRIIMEIEEGLLPRHKEKIGIVYKNLEYQENLRETEEYKKINL